MSLVVKDLSLSRGGLPYLRDVSMTFERGQLTTVIGRTLAGKTTLMRVIAGLQATDGGEVLLDDRPFSTLPAWRRDVAMVYQEFINYPHLTVFDNVAFPLRKKRVDRDEIERRVGAVLTKVGLHDFANRKPFELSGGQQQRVALARALVRQAGILLLDEPLVNLDYKLREQLRGEFRELFADQPNSIVIYNTTEPAEAMMLGDWVVVMHAGGIVQVGEPTQVFDAPASIAVARIINDPPMNIFEGRIDGEGVVLEGGVRLPSTSRLRSLPEGSYRFGIRANEIIFGEEAGLAGRTTFSEVSGSETALHVEGDFGLAILQLEGVHGIALDSQVRVTFRPERLFVFASGGEGELVSTPANGGER